MIVEIIAGVIVLILAVIGIAKLVQRRGGGGGGGVGAKYLEKVQGIAYEALDLKGWLYSLEKNPSNFGEALKRLKQILPKTRFAYKALKGHEKDFLKQVHGYQTRLDDYFQLFGSMNEHAKFLGIIYGQVKAGYMTEDQAGILISDTLQALRKKDKNMYLARHPKKLEYIV